MEKLPHLRERDILKCITDYLEAKKILYIRLHPVRPVGRNNEIRFIPVNNSQRGIPDILIPGPGSIAVEIKAPKGKLSEDQLRWAKRATEWGVRCQVIRSIEELEKILE